MTVTIIYEDNILRMVQHLDSWPAQPTTYLFSDERGATVVVVESTAQVLPLSEEEACNVSQEA